MVKPYQISPKCICGLHMSQNLHPEAGKPKTLVKIGSLWVCIPCTVNALHKASLLQLEAWNKNQALRANLERIANLRKLIPRAERGGLADSMCRIAEDALRGDK